MTGKCCLFDAQVTPNKLKEKKLTNKKQINILLLHFPNKISTDKTEKNKIKQR